jgi:hypothetical protein
MFLLSLGLLTCRSNTQSLFAVAVLAWYSGIFTANPLG